jgi:peroxiredoxin
MKKTIVFLFAVLIIAACSSRKENQFLISGSVIGADTGTVYLMKLDSLGWVSMDSAVLKKGEFELKGSVTAPEKYKLAIRGYSLSYPFFLENSDIKVVLHNDSIGKIDVTGSATQDVYNQFMVKSDSMGEAMKKLDEQYSKADSAGDTATVKKLEAKFDEMDRSIKDMILDFAKAHGKSVIGPYLIIQNSYRFELPDLQAAAAAFDTALSASRYYKSVEQRIAILKSVQIGQPAVQFTMNDTTGKPVELSSLKGKYLLVDFWASWCRPCRAENPNVVKAYQAFHAKGFDVLGVSFDRDKSKWEKAIKDDNLTWNHVSDLKFWGNAAGKLYGISSIPSNVLLDKDQVIIARNIKGEELFNKLTELLGAPAKASKGKKPGKK